MLIEKLLTLLFPVRCAVCEKETEGAKRNKLICSDCLRSFSASIDLYCPLCQAKSIDGGVCFSCKPTAKGNLFLGRLFAPFSYKEAAVRRTIKAFKYDFIEGLAMPLGRLMAGYIEKINKEVDFKDFTVVPVPLHRIKFNRRGYNQSELVAAEISKSLNLITATNLIIKAKPTKDQAGLEDKKRTENLKGAFACPKPEAVSGKKILLFDDVYTTGATMNECARVLKQAGATEVWGLAIARG